MAVFLGGNNVGSLKFLLFLYSNVRGDENRGIALQIIFALGGGAIALIATMESAPRRSKLQNRSPQNAAPVCHILRFDLTKKKYPLPLAV